VQAESGLDELRLHGAPQNVEISAARPALEAAVLRQFSGMSNPEGGHMASATRIANAPADRATAAEADGHELAESPRGERMLAWPTRAGWVVAAVFAIVAGVEAMSIARLESARPAPPAPRAPIVVDSPEGGDAVIVDGRQIGVTPLSLAVTSDVRSIRIQPRPAPQVPAAQEPAAPSERPASNAVTLAAAQAAARERRGGLRLASPVEVSVLEGERVLGSSADGPIVITAGHHELDFINSALGYRSHQAVDITAGEIRPMKIAPPDGRVSVNAVPWAQVTIDGNAVGETPLANLPLPIGDHEITFHHPQFGDQRQHVLVKSNALTRVSVSFSH
jgi:hypothetical protein